MSLQRCLDRLDEATLSAAALGIDASEARRVLDTARTRVGFPSDAYVLALVGGTGVGKSTVLNALAGEEVSAAGPRRPTTAEPVAWLPAEKRAELAELLQWLEVSAVRTHSSESLAELAVLDLPDFDSVAPEHRARVDALLPRVDAVAWIVDPEKYKDEIIHNGYVRTWAPRLARQIVVLNRADLLTPPDAARVRDDLREQLRRDGADIPVVTTHAREGAPGVTELRGWLDSGIEAKRIVAARIGAEAGDAVRVLAGRAGVIDGSAPPLVDPARRDRAVADVARGVLSLVDVPGLERQAVAATRLAARPRGAGPFGVLTSAIYRLTGRARTNADPAGHLRRWRLRGSFAPALEPLRDLLALTVPTAPSALRNTLLALANPATIEERLVESVDRALDSEAAGFQAPTSALWSVIGFAQYLVTGVLLFCALWFAALFVIDAAPVGAVDVPYLGLVPTPVVLLVATLLIGYLLALLLRSHAGWLGRRWARRVSERVTREVRERVRESVLLPIETLDATRERLARAARDLDADCAVK